MELCKVNRLVNPAYPSTKHLTSRDRIHQCIEIMSCDSRDGRSAAFPELRKKSESAAAHSMQEEHDAEANNNSAAHDPDVLPHIYDDEELDNIFERVIAPAEMDCALSG